MSTANNVIDPKVPTSISTLGEEFTKTLTRPNMWGERQDTNWKARYNIWSAQDPTGRKLRARLGKEPFPWDEASDARVPFIDTYINEDVDLVTLGLQDARVLAIPTESGDMRAAKTVSNFVRWMLYDQMDELDDEAELLANYMFERGSGVLGIFWSRETQLTEQTVTLAEVQDRVAPLAQAISDPLREDEAVTDAMALLAQLDSESSQVAQSLTETEVRKIVVALREQQTATYPLRVITENRPRFYALIPGEDFFAPADVTDLQKSRVLFYREFMTQGQLEDAEFAYQWDPDWIRLVIATCKGKASSFNYNTPRAQSAQDRQTFSGLDVANLYEVIHAFEKRPGPDGTPGIYCTVFTVHQQADSSGREIFAYRELLNYQHGQYPFVDFRRERANRRFDSSRGYGEIGFTWQQQVKIEWDSRIDRSSIATIPPLLHPVGRAPTKWGPAVRVPYVRPDEFRFADTPRFDPGSREVELSITSTADRYFGRAVEGRDPLYARRRSQRVIVKWLKGWKRAIQQMFQLCQQFMPEQFWYRVVGSAQAAPLRASRMEIQGKFDLHISFNVLNHEPELLENTLKTLLEVLQADINGVVDRTELMTVIFEFLDPNLGERLLTPAENASAREADDEATVFARLMTGQDVDVKPQGQAYQLRLTTMQQLLQTNPLAQQAYQSNERVREVMDKRMKQLQFQVQQRTVNPMIGRLGA